MLRSIANACERTHAILHTYEALLQPNGSLQFIGTSAESSRTPRRVLVTFTDQPLDSALCGATLSEPALANDWQRAEEDEAWAHLQASK